jgi:hypothetical protein
MSNRLFVPSHSHPSLAIFRLSFESAFSPDVVNLIALGQTVARSEPRSTSFGNRYSNENFPCKIYALWKMEDNIEKPFQMTGILWPIILAFSCRKQNFLVRPPALVDFFKRRLFQKKIFFQRYVQWNSNLGDFDVRFKTPNGRSTLKTSLLFERFLIGFLKPHQDFNSLNENFFEAPSSDHGSAVCWIRSHSLTRCHRADFPCSQNCLPFLSVMTSAARFAFTVGASWATLRCSTHPFVLRPLPDAAHHFTETYSLIHRLDPSLFRRCLPIFPRNFDGQGSIITVSHRRGNLRVRLTRHGVTYFRCLRGSRQSLLVDRCQCLTKKPRWCPKK